METLLVIAQHRNQGYSRSKGYIHGFGSPASTGFKGMNCRSFQSCAGILQSPPPTSPYYHGAQEPKSPQVRSEPPKSSRRSNPITIFPNSFSKHLTFSGSCSELWAGPTYSYSPAPSSLPIPKLSLRQKRSISFDLLDSSSGTLPRQTDVKSSPASPVPSSASVFFPTAASATKNLLRILNLDLNN